MITAYLYQRDSNTVQELDAEGVRKTRPTAHHNEDSGAYPPDENESLHQKDATSGGASGATGASDTVGVNGVGGVNGIPSAETEKGAPPAQPDAKHNDSHGAFKGTVSRCRKGELLWVDIAAPTEDDYHLMMERFELHAMVIEDLKGREGRPKLHNYGDYLYIVFHALSREHEDGDEKEMHDELLLSHTKGDEPRCVLKIQEIDCLIGSDYVITLHPETVKPFEDLKKRWCNTPELMRSGTAQLLYELMDEVLDDYFPLLDDLDEDITALEEQLFAMADAPKKRQEMTSGDIFSIKRALVQVRRIAGPTRDISNTLLRHDAEAGGQHFAYYQDLYDHATRVVDMVDTFRDILSGLHDSYLAMVSNRMNEVMKTLTSASIMLLIPGLIAGIYGMNFDHMPELHSRNGYHIALGAMATIVLVLFGVFKKIDWL